MSTDALGTTLDEIWNRLGPFGKFTVINYCMLLIVCFLAGIYVSVFNFEAMDIDYRCEIPECEHLNESLWLEYAIPKENNKLVKCSRFEFNRDSKGKCDADSFNKSSIVKCGSYVYSDEDSIVKDFDLGCQDWKRTLIGTMYSAGYFVALPLTGVFSDNFGRVKAMAIATTLFGVFGVIKSFSVSYIMLIILEFMESASAAGAYSASFVFGMELVQPKGRVFGNTLMNFSYIVGSMILPMVAWAVQDWRLMLKIVYTPALFGISYLCIVNESPRWLLCKGREEDAIKVLRKAEKMNRIQLNDELISCLKAAAKFDGIDGKTEEREKFTAVFVKVVKSRTIFLTLLLYCYLWIACAFAYYGLSINSVSLGGNKYVNFMLVAFIEMPANALCCMVLNKFGRKRVLITFYTLSAIFCISQTLDFIPKRDSIWPLIFFLAGKFSITVAYSTVYISVSEVFPTNARQSLLAICSTTGRIGSTMAPLTPLLALYYENLPTMVFGSLAIVAALLSFTVPDTNNTSLPDNIKEVEKITQMK